MADSRQTADGEIVTDRCRKLVRVGQLTLGAVGADGHALHDLVWNRVGRYEQLVEYVRARRQASGESTWELVGYDRESDLLFRLGGDLEVCVPGDVVASGCGRALALGALTVLPVPDSLVEAVDTLAKACRVAIRHHSAVGGRLQWFVTPLEQR